MLDGQLVELYQVNTGNLNLTVRRNRERFPADFMLLLQFARPKAGGGRRTLPSVITEQGVAMLSTVLNSPRAIGVNIAIKRTFVRLRAKTSLSAFFKIVFDILKQLMAPPDPPKRPIGFVGPGKP